MKVFFHSLISGNSEPIFMKHGETNFAVLQ